MKHLLIKEIQNAIYNFRFIICILVCFFFIPISTYISIESYKIELEQYEIKKDEFISKFKKNFKPDFTIEGFRKSSKYSFISQGFDNIIPDKVLINKESIYFDYYDEASPYYKKLFKRVDLNFILLNFVSLLIIVLTFDIISRENEQETLKLIFTYSVSKTKFLFAKILSILLIMFISLIISTIPTLIIISKSNLFNITSDYFIYLFLLSLLVIIFYIITLILINIFISIISKKSDFALIVLLLLWCCYSFLIPSINPMLIRIIYPTKSRYEINKEISQIKRKYDNLNKKREKKIIKNVFNEKNIPLHDLHMIHEDENLRNEINDIFIPVKNKNIEKKDNLIKSIENDYNNRITYQNKISSIISLFSPMSCLSLSLSEIAGTGFAENDNFKSLSNIFYSEIKYNIHSYYSVDYYKIGRARSQMLHLSGYNTWDEFRSSLVVPEIIYENVDINNIFNYITKYVLTLICWIAIFYLLCQYSFKVRNLNK